MSDLSLSQLPPNDPENLLSPVARQRILRAIFKSHQIREEALLRNRTRYQARPDCAVSFDDYLSSGKPFIDMAKAQMKAARVVLLVEDEEYRKLDLPERQLHQIMEFMLEARANSLELLAAPERRAPVEDHWRTVSAGRQGRVGDPRAWIGGH